MRIKAIIMAGLFSGGLLLANGYTLVKGGEEVESRAIEKATAQAKPR
ncbi:hypothetical protein ID0476_04650 [Helicobacter pylori]